jgi:hypothetical protein
VLNTASNRAAAVQDRSRAVQDSSSLRQRSSVLAPMATSRATSSNAALSGDNNLATALLLNACPYLAKSLSHLCPLFVGSIGVTSILTRGEIPKADGGKRLLGIPTVTDRVVQQAIAQVLTPIFDPTFSASSFGFVRFAHPAARDQPSAVLRPCGAGRPGRNANPPNLSLTPCTRRKDGV